MRNTMGGVEKHHGEKFNLWSYKVLYLYLIVFRYARLASVKMKAQIKLPVIVTFKVKQKKLNITSLWIHKETLRASNTDKK